MAFPGGFLFVPASLVLAVKDEDELAGMLAHAIAHVASRDGTRQATRAELVQIVSSAPFGLLQMWRKCELDADRLAARKLYATGYDPAALARYIEREQAAYDDYSPRVFSSLPRRAQRLAAIKAVTDQLPARTYPPHEGLDSVQEEVRRLGSR